MQRKEIEKNYIRKIDKLRKFDKAYFQDDKPLVSDREYDRIKEEIIELETKYKYLQNKNSPSKKVDTNLRTGIKKLIIKYQCFLCPMHFLEKM